MNPSIPESCWNSWALTDDESCCSSGYGTASITPDSEPFPVDWETLVDNLTPLDNEIPSTEDIRQSLSLSINPFQEFQTHQECMFYISIQDSNLLIDIEELSLVIVGPSEQSYSVLQKIAFSDKIACSFQPLEPGTYTLNVFYRDVFHIQRSPSQVTVSRNYQLHLAGPVVSLDVELLHPTRIECRMPWGVCCNARTQQLLVADREKHEVLVFGPNGGCNFSFGEPGKEPGQFSRPTALAYDSDGDRILVSDKDNHRIQIFNARGEFLSMFGSQGSQPGQFLFPWGVAVSQNGALIAVADSRNHRIQLFNADGVFLRQFRCTEKNYKSKFDYPRGIVFSNSGDSLYVTDFNLETVFQLDINFTSCIPLIGSGSLKRPSGLTVDNAGNLIVCDSKNNSVKIFKPDGQLLRQLDSIGTSPFNLPLDVTLLQAGYLAILDLNGRVRIV